MTLRPLVLLLYAVGFFNFWGVFSGFYWRIWWYDIPLHLAGGALVGFAFLYMFGIRTSLFPLERNRLLTLLFLTGTVTLVGVLWEFFEYLVDWYLLFAYGAKAGTQPSVADTLADLANDIAGGLGAWSLWRLTEGRKSRTLA
jgi:hypothetical protein